MGYTHYWELNERSFKGSLFSRTVEGMNKIVEASPLVDHWDGHDAGARIIKDYRVEFDGIGDEAHETFCFQAFELAGRNFNFCKTAQKPYDIVVTACLSVAADVIGDGIKVSSDGEPKDWEAGARFASEVLGRRIQVPDLDRQKIKAESETLTSDGAKVLIIQEILGMEPIALAAVYSSILGHTLRIEW